MADLTITPGSVIAASGSTIKEGVAGATITAGQSLYIDTTDSNKLKLADADDAALYACAGIALNGASTGQPVDYVLRSSDLDIGATLSVGTIYVLSGTAGGVAPSADLASGDYAVILGVANATDSMRVDISATNRADTVI